MKKYICFGIALFSLFILPFRVFARDIVDLGLSRGDGLFYSLTAYPGWAEAGYSYNGSVISSPEDGTLFTAVPTNVGHTYGKNGGALSQCGMSFVKDFYYSVSYNFLISDWENYLHPNYSSWSPQYLVNVCRSKSCTPNYPLTSVSSGMEFLYYNNVYSVGSFTVIFKAPNDGTCVSLAFSSYNKSTPFEGISFVGYTYQSLGSTPLTETQIKNALSSDFTTLSNKIEDMKSEQEKTNSKLDSANSSLNDLKDKQDKTNDKLDNIYNSDISEESKESPDTSKYNDYNSAQSSLTDKVKEADLNNMQVDIDTDSSNFIWDTMTSLLNTHPYLMSTIIALLSIGIIKFAFSR